MFSNIFEVADQLFFQADLKIIAVPPKEGLSYNFFRFSSVEAFVTLLLFYKHKVISGRSLEWK